MTRLRSLAVGALAPIVRNRPHVKLWLAEQEQRLVAVGHAVASRAPSLIRPHVDNITVAITAQCNLRCLGCRYERGFMPGQRLSLDTVRAMLDDAAEVGVNNVRLYGGEPLLHPDLPAMVRHAVDVGVTPYVTTNAVLLEKRIDELHEAGLRFITVGFYGVGEDYDRYVQRDGAYGVVERGIAAVRERYPDTVRLRINWLISRDTANLESLHRVHDFADRYDLPIQLDLIHYSLPYFSEGPEGELQFTPEDRPAVEEVTEELERLKRANPGRFEQSELAIRSIPDWLILGSKMRVPCDKYRMIWVGADGTVQLCYVTFKLGNLHETRFRDLVGNAAHRDAARKAFELQCPNCHCGYDSRIQKHLPSRHRYRV